MKRSLLCLAMLCLALPVWAGDDPFVAFRMPAHRISRASLALSASGSRQRYRDVRSLSASPAGNLGYDVGWDSDRTQFLVSTTASGYVNWSHSQQGSASDSYDAESQSRYGNAYVDVSLRRYAEDGPWGVEVGATLSGYTRIQSDGYDSQAPWSSFIERYGRYNSDRLWSTSAGARLGVVRGRVRDAGVVYTVHAIEERLRATGALVRELTPTGRERLAQLLYMRDDFAYAHDYPERFFVAELERVLREDGAIAEGGLDALSAVRVIEPLQPASDVTRQTGSTVGAYVRESHSHYLDRYLQSYYDALYDTDGALVDLYRARAWARDFRTLDEQWVGLTASYHRPIGWAWQVDLVGSVERPVQFGDDGLGVSLDATARWRIADRWDAGLRAAQWRTYLGPRGDREWMRKDDWEAYLTADVGYYVEDHLRLSLSVTEDQSRSNPRGPSNFADYSIYRIGFSYRFLGQLDSPLLSGPVRRLD